MSLGKTRMKPTAMLFQKRRPHLRLSAGKRQLGLLVDEAGLVKRRAKWQTKAEHWSRSCAKLCQDHAQQAYKGAELDFLAGKDKRFVTRESH